MSKQHKSWNPLAKRHFKQIFHRPDALKRDLCSVWDLTWRPGGKKSSFVGDLYRPLGAATMMAQASYQLEDGREGIALSGVTAQIDPTSLVVSYDDIRLSHDLHRVPFEGARGTILDPGQERRGTRGNASWVELALDLDLLRKRAVLQRFRLSAIPALPRFYLGYVIPERAMFARIRRNFVGVPQHRFVLSGRAGLWRSLVGFPTQSSKRNSLRLLSYLQKIKRAR